MCWRVGRRGQQASSLNLQELEERRGGPEGRGWRRALTVGGEGGEGGVVPGQRARVFRAGQRVVVPREGGGRAQHSVGQVRAQVGAVGRRAGCGHPVQGVGTAREGKVHPPIYQVLCRGEQRHLDRPAPDPEPPGAGRGPGNSRIIYPLGAVA